MTRILYGTEYVNGSKKVDIAATIEAASNVQAYIIKRAALSKEDFLSPSSVNQGYSSILSTT
jgi:hypothetical protein